MKKMRSALLTLLAIMSIFAAWSVMDDAQTDAQFPTLIVGNASGTTKAVLVDSSGRIWTNLLSSGDPCMDPNAVKQSVAVTATGELVSLSAGNTITVCGFYATLGGTGPTVTFQTGTGSACGTGTVSLTGAFAPAPNGSEFFLGHGGTVIKSATSGALCIALAGTSPTIAGVMSYVKQ